MKFDIMLWKFDSDIIFLKLKPGLIQTLTTGKSF